MFVFRLFYVAPETTARFSRLDDRSRNLAPPCQMTLSCVTSVPSGGDDQVRRRAAAAPPLLAAEAIFPLLAAEAIARSASRLASRSAMTWRLS